MVLLKQDGWAVSRPGKGAFVAHRDHVADNADDLDDPEATAPVGGMATRVEALERALAEAAQQIDDLRGRVEALETGRGKRATDPPCRDAGQGGAFRFSLRGSRRARPPELAAVADKSAVRSEGQRRCRRRAAPAAGA